MLVREKPLAMRIIMFSNLFKRIFGFFFFLCRSTCQSHEKKVPNFFVNILGLLLFSFLCIYYGSLYYFHPLDPSFMTVSSPSSHVQNPFGANGAYISGFVIYYFGLGSCFLTFPMIVGLFLLLFKGKSSSFFFKFFLSWLSFFVSLLFLLQKHLEAYSVEGIELPPGGAFGFLVHEWFLSHWGVYGSHTFVVLSVWFFITVLFRVNFISPKLPLFLKAIFRIFFVKLKNIFLCLRFFLKLKGTTKENQRTFKKEETQEKKDFLVREEAKILKKKPSDEKFFASVRAIFRQNLDKNQGDEALDAEVGQLILKTLAEFGVKGKLLDFVRGPSLVTYNFQPEEGVRQAKVFSLVDDLALALKVQCVIIKPAPDKRALGIQVPRTNPDVVYLGDILKTKEYLETTSPLTLAFGLSEKGEAICEDLAAMPHLLIAGSTGSGKSVCINTFICSVLAKASPEEVRFLMIDPKMLELSVYNKIPHLLAPVVTTDLNKAKACLNWAVYEMERRYSLMEKASVRDLSSYNLKFGNNPSHEKLPFIVVIIDELADLMLMAAKDIEQLIQRLTQKARACGIHLILATQRPSVDVVTGIIKANLPCRVSFRVVSRYDSKTILDQNDAEKLLGRGDMFFMKPGEVHLKRIQGAFISEKEIHELVEKLAYFGGSYDEGVVSWIDLHIKDSSEETFRGINPSQSSEELYDQAKDIARTNGLVSTSFLQRHLGLGYNRAAKIIDKMEEEALISGPDGSKKRKWIKKD